MSKEYIAPELIEKIRQTFRYDSGILFWDKLPQNHRRRAFLLGRVAGTKSKVRWTIGFEGRLWPRTYLIWLMFNDELPDGDIDHRDRDSLNDKIENLRSASHDLNLVNCKLHKNNKSGYRGVYFSKRRGKWIAEIGCGYAGQHDTAEEAARAVEALGKRVYGEFWSGASPDQHP